MFEKLISWSTSHYSHLPWRTHRSMYHTLVSEIMLQQTTVGTVLNHFEKFLKRFPDLFSLAVATEEELLIEWKGLGYYRRAKNLKKIAEQIKERHRGEFPDSVEELLKLNGVGLYTANALMAMGREGRHIAVDANLERVLSRFYGIKLEKGPKLTKEIYRLYDMGEILNIKKTISFRELNEALMDLGRVYCKARFVECQNCPLQSACIAFKERNQLNYPLCDEKKTKESHELKLIRVIIRKNSSRKMVLAYQKKKGEWLEGQWELPTFILESTDKKLTQYPPLKTKMKTKMKIKEEELISFKTTITKYKITNYILELEEKKCSSFFPIENFSWMKNDENSNLSTASLKALKKIDIN